MKTWVVIKRIKTGKIEAWRDYGDHAWGAATYEVVGYCQGSHKNALQYGINQSEKGMRNNGNNTN